MQREIEEAEEKRRMIAFRPAIERDFDYCRQIYFNEMNWIIVELHLDRAAQEAGFLQQWNPAEVRLVIFEGADAGWIQTARHEDALFVAQMFVDRHFQRKGIGTELMKRLIAEAGRLPVRLSVVKINPARQLYQRLGFRITHEDDRKFYMTRDADLAPGDSTIEHKVVDWPYAER